MEAVSSRKSNKQCGKSNRSFLLLKKTFLNNVSNSEPFSDIERENFLSEFYCIN